MKTVGPRRLTAAEALAEEAAMVEGASDTDRSALCLSGGGVRSAAFCLGVLQGLAQARVLGQFHYLSTVSGGGYVGAWLTALVGTHGRDGIAMAEAELRRDSATAGRVRELRRAGNFLTPEVGAFSADTWAGITLYVRNLLMTWLAFLPPVLLVVLVLIFYRTALAVSGAHAALAASLLVVACACLGVSTYRACRALPSHVGEAARLAPVEPIYHNVWLALAWPALAPAAIAVGLDRPTPALVGGPLDAALLLGGAYAISVMAAYLVALAVTRLERVWLARERRSGASAARARARASLRLYRHNLAPWVLATLIAAVMAGFGTWLLGRLTDPSDQVAALAVLGPFWLAIAMVFHTGAHIGFRREARFAELDREWTARFSALILRAGGAAAFAAFCVLGLSALVLPEQDDWTTLFWAKLLSPLVTGPLAAWLGQRAVARIAGIFDIDPGWRDMAIEVALGLLAVAFAAALLAGLASVVQVYGLGPIQQWLVASFEFFRDPRCAMSDVVLGLAHCVVHPVPVWLMLGVQVLLMLVLAAIAWQMTVDNNRFSLHGLYRNRLVRAFIGAARHHRMPDPLTGFDPEDDPRLADLAPMPRRLFPVLNMAVNLTSSNHPEWQERKALSFTATPLHCGFMLPGPESEMARTYVGTRDYAGRSSTGAIQGLRLGVAMTISGAAASPNWGYHSSASTAFLMTLFNLRLGVWLPNPSADAGVDDLSTISPLDQRRAMAGDLLGRTSITGRAIYLSDGGHFDNLGLYEMLRRRCTLVVVVDASQDGDCGFGDLGAAIRKAAIDLGIGVSLATDAFVARGSKPATNNPARGFAVGQISYPATSDRAGFEGRLLYIKPAWLPDLPVDVRAYGLAQPDFPHESTGDQWFSESQFESYRRLGAHQIARILGTSEPASLSELFTLAEPNATGSAARPG